MQIDFQISNINLPTSIDWLNTALITLTIAIISGTVIELAKQRVTPNRSLVFISGVLIFDIAVIFVWYTLIGYAILMNGANIEASNGCIAAIPTYKRALSWNPKINELQPHLLECYISIQRPSQLQALLQPIDSSLTDNWYYWAQISLADYATRDYSKMVEAAEQAADLSAQNTEWITDLAQTLHREQNFEFSVQLLRIVRTHNLSDKNALFWLAWSLYESGAYYDALAHFDDCTRTFTNGYEAGRCWAGGGFTYMKLGRYSEAKNAFNVALSIWPRQEDVSNVLNSLP